MSIESRSRQYGKVFDHWQIREFLGSGSGGKSAVFRLVHANASSVKSALKVISLIEKRGDFESLPESRKAEYERVKQKCKDCAEQEVLLMNGLQGRTNVVDYLDHTFVDWADESGFGCDMLIRMELLKDLRGQIEDDHKFSQDEVLKIGREICSALVLCHRKEILHRDIKPENIFYNDDGNYKLGDFGVSRILSAVPMSKASTGVCTPEYAAPEQMSGKYDTRVDIYSLGLVLYELSNDHRLPFSSSSYISEIEVQERLLGKPFPAPRNASDAFAAVILKACAFNPNDRYQTAEAFLAELDYLAGIGPLKTGKTPSGGRGTQKATPAIGGNITQYAVADIAKRNGSRETVYASSREDRKPAYQTAEKPKKWFPKGVIAGVVVFLACVLFLLIMGREHKHIWVDATCTAPRACEECGETEGNSLGHRWSDATCTAPRTCEDCGETEDSSLGHSWSDATCTSASVCRTCGQMNGTALGHMWIDATYETPKTCNVCGATEGEAMVRPWIYINELDYIQNDGKVWTMSNDAPGYYADSDITDSEAYKDESIPGHVTGPVYDYLGNEYTYGLCVDGLDYTEYSVTYRLDGQYTTFSGYVSMTPDVRWDSAAEKGKYFEVYGDGVLLGRSPIMTNSLPAQEFRVDVTGVEMLTIRYPKTTGPSRMAMIYDGKLS